MNKFNVIVRYDKHYCKYENRMECDDCEHYDDWDGCSNYTTVVEAFSAIEVNFTEDALPHETALEVKINNKKSISIPKFALLYFELNGKVYYEYKETTQEDISIFEKIQNLIPMPSPTDVLQIKEYLESGMEQKLLCAAIDTAKLLESKSNIVKWNYAKGIMKCWHDNEIKALEEIKMH